MNITGICPYETPCGWCSKWDKKCDKKIGYPTKEKVNSIDSPLKGIVANRMCQSESDHEWECCGISTIGTTYRCKKCGAYKTDPFEEYPDISVTLSNN